MKEDFYPALQPGEFYHIYNRGNNRENIFYKQENYSYFLRKYDAYLSDYLDTYAYCLLPNHFHLLVRVRERIPSLEGMVSVGQEEPPSHSERSTTFLKSGTSTLTEPSAIISELFRRFFTSYAKSINKQENRVGSLFQKNLSGNVLPTILISPVWYIIFMPTRSCMAFAVITWNTPTAHTVEY